MKARLTLAAATVAVWVVSSAGPVSAANERMHLTCESGTLAGHTLERTNGSSWWDVESGAVYTTKTLVIESDGSRYEKHYGHEAATGETCMAEHFDWFWSVTVVPSGANR